MQQLNSMQMDAIGTIIDYVCKQGDITPATMMSPALGSIPIDAFGDKASFLNNYVVMLHDVIDDDKLKA